jgi:photosystem II stability/assembly factor-like uncharacterized protein
MDALSAVLTAAPDGTLFAVCAGEPSVGFQAKTTARSADGGRSWAVRAPCGGKPCQGSPLDFGYLGAADAVSGSTVYLAGARSPLLVTRDGGARWHVVRQVNAGTDAGTSQVIFFSRADGVVLGQDSSDDEMPTLWRTADAGARWSAVHPLDG